jgi:hypothetical protein
MSYKTSIIVSISCFFLLLAWAFHPLIFFMIAMTDGPPRRGNPLDSWQTTNNHFKIKITAYDEEGAYLSGTYYGFSSSKADEDEWQEFLVIRHDDRPDVSRDQIRFVNDRVGYVFIGGQFAASTDAGATWSIWDAKTELVNKKYGPIKDVQMTEEGMGEMIISPIEKEEEEIKLKSSNYGREWRVSKDGA